MPKSQSPEKPVSFVLRMPPWVYAKLKKLAKEEHRTMTAVIMIEIERKLLGGNKAS